MGTYESAGRVDACSSGVGVAHPFRFGEAEEVGVGVHCWRWLWASVLLFRCLVCK